jgi:transcriptional regulator with GAF, ATPase, and Fis domain
LIAKNLSSGKEVTMKPDVTINHHTNMESVSVNGMKHLDLLTIDSISPGYLDEWKERARSWEVLSVFIEQFCMKQRIPLSELMNILEKTILIKVLSSFNGNQKDAAKFLGTKYTTLNEKVKKYNIKFLKNPTQD